ncbi:hypothetical protein BDZ89DRAFT_1207079 [Hymenopellis radicata]|nr:hypothetical protein BDZ89DRAFT_1207079 [Hymenopellis radicata]
MLQTTQCLLAPRRIPKLGPIRHIGALQKRTLGASTTRPKLTLPGVSVEMRAFHNSSKNSVACPTADSSTIRMPLSTLTTWPPRVLSAFRPRPLQQRRHSGPYLTVLDLCFSLNSEHLFMITPHVLSRAEIARREVIQFYSLSSRRQRLASCDDHGRQGR